MVATRRVPVDRAALKKIADDSGGAFHAAASLADVERAYTQLGHEIGYTTQPLDLSPWFIPTGVPLALLGTRLSCADIRLL